MAQWQYTCLVWMRPWVQSSVLRKEKKSFLKITALWPIFDPILVKMESVYQLFKKK